MKPTLAQLTRRAIAHDRWDDARMHVERAARSSTLELLSPAFAALDQAAAVWRGARQACIERTRP